MDSKIIRVIEIGATYTRRADISLPELKISGFKTGLTSDFAEGDVIQKIIEFAGENLSPDTTAVAVAVAGPIQNNNLVEFLPNFSAFPNNTDLAAPIKQKLNLPAIIVNDMEAAVFGMAHLLKERENYDGTFWGITWSSGIGGRFWDGQKIVSDSEIGHIILDISPQAPICGCGKKGHAEALLSGQGMKKIISQNFADQIKPTANIFQQLNQAYQQQQDWAIEFYQKRAKWMGIFLANLVQINRSQRIYFKGTVAKNLLKLPQIKEQIIKTIAESVISPAWAVTEINLSPDEQNDSLIGAALISQNKF